MTQEDQAQNQASAPAEAPIENLESAQPAPEVDEVVTITNIDSFAAMIGAWHANRVARINHMLDVPLGTEVQVGETNHVLEDDYLEGFKLGLHVALHEIGVLPFVAEMETPAEAAAEVANQAIEAAKAGELPDLESTLGLTG